jgi:aryl-alcohol dehydrogenase-like predicted oxidoreductase
METRALGKTGHTDSILIFGGFALYQASQREADAGLETALEKGVGHIDVSPIYGQAEARIGDWIGRHGKRFFVGCKTDERDREGARRSLERSLKTLKVDYFDLFQLHGVDSVPVLDRALGPGGAMEAILEARERGLVRFIGITGHNPPLQNLALERFDFDTVMFPLNRVHAAYFNEWNDFRPLLETARRKNVGVQVIKSVAKGTWGEGRRGASHLYNTWYEPFDDPAEIEKSLWYALSQDITAAVLPGDLRLWPMIYDAADRFQSLSPAQQADFVAQAAQYRPLAGPVMD